MSLSYKRFNCHIYAKRHKAKTIQDMSEYSKHSSSPPTNSPSAKEGLTYTHCTAYSLYSNQSRDLHFDFRNPDLLTELPASKMLA